MYYFTTSGGEHVHKAHNFGAKLSIDIHYKSVGLIQSCQMYNGALFLERGKLGKWPDNKDQFVLIESRLELSMYNPSLANKTKCGRGCTAGYGMLNSAG